MSCRPHLFRTLVAMKEFTGGRHRDARAKSRGLTYVSETDWTSSSTGPARRPAPARFRGTPTRVRLGDRGGFSALPRRPVVVLDPHVARPPARGRPPDFRADWQTVGRSIRQWMRRPRLHGPRPRNFEQRDELSHDLLTGSRSWTRIAVAHPGAIVGTDLGERSNFWLNAPQSNA